MIAIGKLDALEMAVIPVILGDGIPLFPQGTGELELRLVRCETKAKGGRPASALRAQGLTRPDNEPTLKMEP